MTDEEKKLSNRRGFVTTALTTIASAFAAASAVMFSARSIASSDENVELSKNKKAHKVQYGMVIDVRRCIGCHACTIACKSEFDVPLGENRSWVEYTEKGVYPHVGRSFLPRLCNHCSEPSCVRVCPTNATYKRKQDGIVVVDAGLCIGCKYCIQACPYDARFLNEESGKGWVEKCDFCVHRVQKGLVPSCVNTCVGGARIFGDLGDPHSNVSILLAKNRTTVLRRAMGTFPNVYYIGADLTDELDASRPEMREINVITHRPNKERR